MTEALPETLELLAHLESQAEGQDKNLMEYYKPYPQQIAFHNAGSKYSQRCFMAANRTGKTFSSVMENAYHLTGLYPDWWEGLIFDGPTRGWVCGEKNDVIRDTTQRLLFGDISVLTNVGKGAIPAKCIGPWTRSQGFANLIDYAKVLHVPSGQWSELTFKSYKEGREAFQASELDWIHYDEEPDQDIYEEGLTRTSTGKKGQCSWLTYTPLKGMSEVTHGFYNEPSRYQTMIQMTIDDVDHFTPEQREEIISSYQPHMRDARTKGIPSQGSGAVFPISAELIEEEPFKDLPLWWAYIIGGDFGWDHPQAWVLMGWDRDLDIIHVIDSFKARETTPATAASRIRQWGEWIPTAWPHDGYIHDKGSGDELATQYRDFGVNMLHEHATHPTGGFGTEAGVSEMLNRMQLGKFKVNKYLRDWWDEFHGYHRDQGKIVKTRDDLMSASRIGTMMIRFAEAPPAEEEEEDYERHEESALGWS